MGEDAEAIAGWIFQFVCRYCLDVDSNEDWKQFKIIQLDEAIHVKMNILLRIHHKKPPAYARNNEYLVDVNERLSSLMITTTATEEEKQGGE